MPSRNKESIHSRRWRRLRAQKLAADPFCECDQCKFMGDFRIATEVDHRIPRSAGGEVFAWSNLQSLCKSHHSKKTWNEMKGQQAGIEATDPNTGRPLDPNHPMNRQAARRAARKAAKRIEAIEKQEAELMERGKSCGFFGNK